MKIINSKKKNTKIYDKNTSYWNKVDKQTHYLIADILNRKLPLANCRDKKIFTPNDDADYRVLCADYENDYGDDLPSQKEVSEEIAYEYLFLVVKGLLSELKEFKCHQAKYFNKLF